ncbi:hypothetical protein FACS1894211_16610 [Clostridia bacterium]|nr:hypothetical protein FACS1894211_16610 [Clostridia bacterium]
MRKTIVDRRKQRVERDAGFALQNRKERFAPWVTGADNLSGTAEKFSPQNAVCVLGRFFIKRAYVTDE